MKSLPRAMYSCEFATLHCAAVHGVFGDICTHTTAVRRTAGRNKTSAELTSLSQVTLKVHIAAPVFVPGTQTVTRISLMCTRWRSSNSELGTCLVVWYGIMHLLFSKLRA